MLANVVDVKNWQTTFAINHAVGNWDSYGYQNSQNTYSYKPRNNPWRLIIWDANIAFGNGGADTPSFEQMFDSSDPIIDQFYSLPGFRRSYIRILQQLAANPLVVSNAAPILNAKYAAFQDHAVAADFPAVIKSSLDSARNLLLRIVASNSPPFAITSAEELSPRSTDRLLTLTGTAPIDLTQFSVNGEPVPVFWQSNASGLQWKIRITLTNVTQKLLIEGFDEAGILVPATPREVTASYSGKLENPQDVLVFSEIMHRPSAALGDFVELFNGSTNNTFEVSGWRIEPLGIEILESTFLAAQGRLVFARDAGVFASLYRNSPSPNGVFTRSIDPNGGTLRWVQPGGSPLEDRTIRAVTYGTTPPWPVLATNAGFSLQLREGRSGGDDRPGNWAVFQVPPPETNNWVRALATGLATGTHLLLYLSNFPVIPSPDDIVGFWKGRFDGMDAPLLFHFRRDPTETLLATFIFGTDENPGSLPATSASYSSTDRTIRLVQQGDVGSYSGRLSIDGLRITGGYLFQGGGGEGHKPFP
ncbi:MAG: hypothetical protein EXS36_07185 [Pedosphaera sp.]|nr:hypothetical protein [Pedosphaera sp.]